MEHMSNIISIGHPQMCMQPGHVVGMGRTEDRIRQNDPTLTELFVGSFNGNLHLRGGQNFGLCVPSDGASFARLGNSIGENTSLVTVCFGGNLALGDDATREFAKGLQRNSSIRKVRLSRCNLSEGAGCELLKAFEKNSSNLKEISLVRCDFGNGGFRTLTSTLSKCTGLARISLHFSEISDELMGIFIGAIRKHHHLETLDLSSSNVGSTGCEALATLLKDTNSSLCVMALDRNNIDNNGAIFLANALIGNTTLEELHLDGNHNITSVGWDAFSQVLCNTSSINDTYVSNHILQSLEEFVSGAVPKELAHSLDLNCSSNDRKEIATKKVLLYHHHFDMAPFFEWGLKVLPLAVSWLDRARGFHSNNKANIDVKILSSIYQFAKAMPMQFVPVTRRARAIAYQKR
mmetsp:Transcript_20335/g.42555  ORF Transcript_20335/g.42555 Transcript_20335/m.42555 type:complete len:405 (-) Transcript_20335:97-1311(-)